MRLSENTEQGLLSPSESQRCGNLVFPLEEEATVTLTRHDILVFPLVL